MREMRIAYFTFKFFLFIGWAANIFQILSNIPATFGEMAPIFVVKCVGVFFFPIGAILGWAGFL